MTFGKSWNLFSVAKFGQHFHSDCHYKKQVRNGFVYAATNEVLLGISLVLVCLILPESSIHARALLSSVLRPRCQERDSYSISYMCNLSAFLVSCLLCFLDVWPVRDVSLPLQNVEWSTPPSSATHLFGLLLV